MRCVRCGVCEVCECGVCEIPVDVVGVAPHTSYTTPHLTGTLEVIPIEPIVAWLGAGKEGNPTSTSTCGYDLVVCGFQVS